MALLPIQEQTREGFWTLDRKVSTAATGRVHDTSEQ